MGVNGRYVADRDQTNWALRFNPTDKNLLERRGWIESLMVNQAKDMKKLDAKIRFELEEFFKRFDRLKNPCCCKQLIPTVAEIPRPLRPEGTTGN
jgi:hypothetical protein